MTEANGKIEISKEDLDSIDFTRLLAYSVASGGAMGEPGGVEMLMRDGTLYHFNFFESEIQPNDFKSRVSVAGLHGLANLGFGNHLHFQQDNADWLLAKRDRYMQTSDESFTAWPTATLYKKWVDFFRERIAEGRQ